MKKRFRNGAVVVVCAVFIHCFHVQPTDAAELDKYAKEALVSLKDARKCLEKSDTPCLISHLAKRNNPIKDELWDCTEPLGYPESYTSNDDLKPISRELFAKCMMAQKARWLQLIDVCLKVETNPKKQRKNDSDDDVYLDGESVSCIFARENEKLKLESLMNTEC